MLVAKQQGKTFKKLFRLETGEFILATFEVISRDGVLKARLVATEELPDTSFTTEAETVLPTASVKSVPEFIYVSDLGTAHFSYEDFSFLVSQPTRAPAFAF